ncbi:MAG TPA: beta-galactosidase, partial [Kiritimatiellia bacterium]
TPARAFDSFIQMRDGYFYDPAAGTAWVPHGIAYQTWNRPLGVWQTWDQINYDLDEMVKMGANSIRVDFVWQHIEEQGDNQFSWDNYDYLVQECEKRNIRIFALVGYQWPPNWFPDNWYTMHPPETDAEGIYHTNRWQSDIIGYETPEARAQYTEFFANVCARYATNKAVAAWIVGNEYGYLGLWSGLLDGYDTNCETAFRGYVQQKYTTVTNANNKLGTAYTAFSQVKFVDQYRAYGVEGAVWADMVQWREDSIASFTALSAKAAKLADTNHLISYSTVGMQWGEEDWRYHAEDRGKITAYAAASNAPIDFFSVNNYPWSILGHESQNGHWGVSFTKKVAKVPVLYTETGFSSSESMWPGMNEARQGPLIRNAMWESLEVGAIGTHIFSWMDRPYITQREKGFGIVYADRGIKPAFWTSANAFRLMEQTKMADLLAGSKDPVPDIAFLWTDAADSQYNRYECEMQQIAGALERIGYEPNFLNLAELGAGTYTNYKAIILPRNMRVEDVVPNSTNKTVLEFLRTVVLPKGIHVMASADIPGAQNFNGKARAQYVNEVRSLFGVDPTDPGGFEIPQRRKEFVNLEHWKKVRVAFNASASAPLANTAYQPYVWKYNDEVTLSTGGVLWANMNSGRNKGFESSTTAITNWFSWNTTNYIRNSTAALVRLAGWQYNGSNMVMLRGDAGIWADAEIVPFGRYSHSAFLRVNNTNSLATGAYASVGIEWYGESNRYLGITENVLTTHTASLWVKSSIVDTAPSNTVLMRRIIRTGSKNLVANPGLTGTGVAPTSWLAWNDTQHDPNAGSYLGTSGNSWMFWFDGGIYQDITTGFAVGDRIGFGGWLYTPSWDAFRNGTKYGIVSIEFYNGTNIVATTQTLQQVNQFSAKDTWNGIS